MEKPEASLAIQVLPLGALPLAAAGDGEMLRIVDAAIGCLKASGLKCVVGPFETVVEGDFETLMRLAAECQKLCVREGAPSLLTYMKMAYNPSGGVLSIDEKTAKHST